MAATCPKCNRVFRVNMDGQIRRHWCAPEVGDSKNFKLATGGTLTLRLSANWMLFGEAERTLLCSLLDTLHEYERSHLPADLSAAPHPKDHA